MHISDEHGFVVALGAEVPLVRLQNTLLQVCKQLVVRPAGNGELLTPALRSVVFVEIALDLDESGSRDSPRPRGALVRFRHTPSATLRRVVSRATASFGSVRLLVRRVESLRMRRASPLRVEVTSLAGFLRGGRVVQEDTVLHIVRGGPVVSSRVHGE